MTSATEIYWKTSCFPLKADLHSYGVFISQSQASEPLKTKTAALDDRCPLSTATRRHRVGPCDFLYVIRF